MSDPNRTWKEELEGVIDPALENEIEIFETQIELRRQDKVEERLFAETRLRRGVYGQRYDNGLRHDGEELQPLGYREHASKGPNTVWDAPGMQRIKVPYGGMTGAQLEVVAELAEEYADEILHVTTRQDLQLHYVHLEDTPDIMRRLGAMGITTREACGNSVRNVTGCHLAGVCKTEPFDVTPHAHALAAFLLGHPDAQDFGRKFKIAFSGCVDEACAVTSMHDLGFIARTRVVDGRTERGFEAYAGGGLGAVPHQAKLLFPFVPEAEVLPISQAACRVFARHGEKKNRARARLKFLIQKIGVEPFRELVEAERKILPHDERWTSHLGESFESTPPPSVLIQLGSRRPDTNSAWRERNVAAQRQDGWNVVTIPLPLGDISSSQARGLADIARRYARDNLRATIEQNLVLRWVRDDDLDAVERELSRLNLADPHAGTIVDVTACPGTDTCKLGIASSRGLARELSTHLAEKSLAAEEAVRALRIKVSGCFNSCGHHHISDLGFYGVSRKRNGHAVPHFQVVVGGQWSENAGAFGLATQAVPSKRIPEVVDRLTSLYLEERSGRENFRAWVERIGKARIREVLEPFTAVRTFDEAPQLYADWGDTRTYSMKDHGVGECAGEVVPIAEFGLQAAEREVFEAQLDLDASRATRAAGKAYHAMLTAAATLVRIEWLDLPDDTDRIVDEFRTRFYDTKLFFDPFAKGKFASYLFRVHAATGPVSLDEARRRVEEAQLFIEGAHGAYERLLRRNVG